MINLVLASLFLPLSHFLIASTALRSLLVRRFGERRYSNGYSLLAFAAFAWMIWAYHDAPAFQLWHAPRCLKLALWPLMLLASILVIAGLTTPNPVIVRSEHLFGNPDIVHGVLRISRNPFFWGTSIFAVSHMITIGSMASNLAFGSVAILSLAGARVLDAKKAQRHGIAWQTFAIATSDVPFLAIVRRRQRLALGEIGWWRASLGVAVFLLTLLFHGRLFGGNVISILVTQAGM